MTDQVYYKILLLEDNPDDALLIRRAGLRLNPPACVEWIQRPDELIQLVQDGLRLGEEFCLLILDSKLSGVTGVEILRHLRTIDPGLAIPVVIFSSYPESFSGDIDHGTVPIPIISKPVIYDEFINVTQKIITTYAVDGRLQCVRTRLLKLT